MDQCQEVGQVKECEFTSILFIHAGYNNTNRRRHYHQEVPAYKTQSIPFWWQIQTFQWSPLLPSRKTSPGLTSSDFLFLWLWKYQNCNISSSLPCLALRPSLWQRPHLISRLWLPKSTISILFIRTKQNTQNIPYHIEPLPVVTYSLIIIVISKHCICVRHSPGLLHILIH